MATASLQTPVTVLTGYLGSGTAGTAVVRGRDRPGGRHGAHVETEL
ncbi:MAG TPA: hypothetical protein VGJ20_28175 [Xanthobacteraceae bacterium]|jgi:hypothetical protein